MAKFCLILLCPPAVEEKLFDLLLTASDTDVFTSTSASTHGLAHDGLSSTDQVLGRSASAQIQTILDEADVEPLLAKLRSDFRGAGVRYWAYPLALEGEI